MLTPWAVLSACDGAAQSPANAPGVDAEASVERDAAGAEDAGGSDAQAARDAAPPAAEERLLDHTGWRIYDAAFDPLEAHQPALIECGIAGWYADTQAHLLDVETGLCNYSLLEHPAQRAVQAGDELHLRLWYFDLIAEQPAEAHLAVLFGDDLVWETRVPIPSAADVIDVRFAAPHGLALGEPIRWHLHNHGQNSWVLASLAVTPAP